MSEWRCMGNPPGDVSQATEMQCPACRQVLRIPPGFYTEWSQVNERVPEHECKPLVQV